MIRLRPTPSFVCLLLLVVAMSACGGGGGGTINPPPPPPPVTLSISTVSPLPSALVGQPYTASLQAKGGTAPYTWSSQLLGIPGIALASTGVLSGSPGTPGSYGPVITVTDSNGKTASASIELDVFAPLIFTSSAALPDVNIALPDGQYIYANGGKPPYTFSLAQGSSMPPGLSFKDANGAGLVQGTPTTPGSYSFTLQVKDSFSPPLQISQAFTMNVLNGVVVPNQNLPDAVQNLPYNEQVKVFGGTPPYHFALFPNAIIPPGLAFGANTGIFSGTPTMSSQFPYSFYMTITDSATPTPASIQAYPAFNIQPPLSIQNTPLSDCPRSLNCNDSVIVMGGRSPYTLTVSSGSLPPGVTLSQTPSGPYYYISGQPTTDGTYPFVIKVTDSYDTPVTAMQNFQIRVADQLSLSGPGSIGILYNQSYSVTFPASGGIPPYTWSIDALPSGFTFDTTTGTLSGTANGASGSYTHANAYVQDSSNPPQHTYYSNFVLDIYGKLTILPSSLPPVTAASNVTLALPSSGGAAPLQWSLASGSLPAGITFGTSDDLALISGTPATAGTYTFTVALADGNTGNLHQTASQQYTWVVKSPSQIGRNDTVNTATPISNIFLLASISPFSDPRTAGPDVDYYSMSAAPGSIVQIGVDPNNDLKQPPEPNSMQPVFEIVDSNGARYQTCGSAQANPGQLYNLPCVNNLPGNPSYLQGDYYGFQVPGSGATPVTFYVRISDERGDARPDFLYTLSVYGVN